MTVEMIYDHFPRKYVAELGFEPESADGGEWPWKFHDHLPRKLCAWAWIRNRTLPPSPSIPRPAVRRATWSACCANADRIYLSEVWLCKMLTVFILNIGSSLHKNKFVLNFLFCIYPKYWNTLSTYHICPKIWNSPFYYFLMCLKYCCMCTVCVANRVDADQTPRSAALV